MLESERARERERRFMTNCLFTKEHLVRCERAFVCKFCSSPSPFAGQLNDERTIERGPVKEQVRGYVVGGCGCVCLCVILLYVLD